jgi:hypothetical protein
VELDDARACSEISGGRREQSGPCSEERHCETRNAAGPRRRTQDPPGALSAGAPVAPSGSSQQITADPPPLSGRFWCRGEILMGLSPGLDCHYGSGPILSVHFPLEAVVFRWLLVGLMGILGLTSAERGESTRQMDPQIYFLE